MLQTLGGFFHACVKKWYSRSKTFYSRQGINRANHHRKSDYIRLAATFFIFCRFMASPSKATRKN
jgi:hypothetical protein